MGSAAHRSSAQMLEFESGGISEVQPRTRRFGLAAEGGKSDWIENSKPLKNRFQCLD